MLDNITNNISKIIDRVKGKKFISEDDLNQTLREIRIALLEADVALPIAKEFIEKVKIEAVGQQVIKSVTAGQMIVKIVHDKLINLLGDEKSEINLNAKPPIIIMAVGLQGAGKTTNMAKLALRLKTKNHKRVLLASLDTYRPAAQEQLEILAKSAAVDSLEIISGQKPMEIVDRAIKNSSIYDIVIYDTAGRLHIDDNLMNELKLLKGKINPTEALLVVDSLTGQDAVNVATVFDEQIGVTGIILSRIDGDSRGGAAISMKYVTQKPIKFLATGEKLENLEKFDHKRIASRILGMGDVVSLVEKAMDSINQDDATAMGAKLSSGRFDLGDFLAYINTMKKMGGLSGVMSMLPSALGGGMNLKDVDLRKAQSSLSKQEAIILSMTPKERIYPAIINGSRKRRIAAGSGVSVVDINKLLKQHQTMERMMKKVSKSSPLDMIKSKFGGLFGG